MSILTAKNGCTLLDRIQFRARRVHLNIYTAPETQNFFTFLSQWHENQSAWFNKLSVWKFLFVNNPFTLTLCGALVVRPEPQAKSRKLRSHNLQFYFHYLHCRIYPIWLWGQTQIDVAYLSHFVHATVIAHRYSGCGENHQSPAFRCQFDFFFLNYINK